MFPAPCNIFAAFTVKLIPETDFHP